MPAVEYPPVLSLSEAAGYLGADVKTVRALLQSGEVPGRKTAQGAAGGRWLIPKAGLDNWLMNGGNNNEG